MLPSQKIEKRNNKNSKNNLIPRNSIIKNILTNTKLNSFSSSNRSKNKYNIKRIKNNSSSNFTVTKKEENKKKLNIKSLNIAQIPHNKQSTIDKKNKILERINNAKNNDNNLFNICQLSHFLRDANLKQTIIIDNEGNNNLDLLINQNKKNNIIEQQKNEGKNTKIFRNKLSNLLFDTNYQNNLKNKNFNKTQNQRINYNIINNFDILKKNDEEIEEKNIDSDNIRVNEFSKIFDLLNENIEQFKNILKKKDSNLNNNEHKKNINDINKNNINNINFISLKDNYKINNINNIQSNVNHKKFKSNTNFSKTKKPSYINNDKNKIKPDNLGEIVNINESSLNKSYSCNFSKEKNNSEFYSFLDSFTQDDLFLPLTAKHQKHSTQNLSNILNIEKKEEINQNKNKKEIDKFSSNDMSTGKCYDEEELQIDSCAIDEQIKCDEIKSRDINPHFFSKEFVNNEKVKEKKRLSLEKDCNIF